MTQNIAELKEGINTLVTEYEKLDAGINEYTSGVAQIVAGYSQVANGCTTLVKGNLELAEGSSQLYEGITEMLSGIVEFYEATGSLKDGTGELRDKTSGMDTQISDKIDEMLESITGGDGETVSFVSEKNTNVEAVQFVIQTEAVEIEIVEPVPATLPAIPSLKVREKDVDKVTEYG
ncbi:MAG: hypothetical protein ACI4FW_05765 [Bariatricus sp.]